MVSDAHAHLDPIQYPTGLDEVIARAKSAGLKWVINVAMLSDGAEQALAVTAEHDFMRAVVGCHPHDAKRFDEKMLGRLEELAARAEVVGIGEIGLDFYRDHSPRPAQEEALAAQLDLARRLDLPVIIHDREAHERTLEIIRAAGETAGMFHCFSGDVGLARRVLDLGFFISVPGVVTFPKAEALRQVVAFTPLERLLVETDCPFLAPVPFRGRRNEPAYVVETAKKTAEIKGVSYDELAAQTTANLEALFGLEG